MKPKQYAGLLRFLAAKLAGIQGLTPRVVVRAICMAGYNANPDQAVSHAEPGLKAVWADQDAEAVLGVASDELPVAV